MITQAGDKKLLTTKQVAEMLNLCDVTVRKLDIPRIQIGDRKLRWRKEDVEAWMRRNVNERN